MTEQSEHNPQEMPPDEAHSPIAVHAGDEPPPEHAPVAPPADAAPESPAGAETSPEAGQATTESENGEAVESIEAAVPEDDAIGDATSPAKEVSATEEAAEKQEAAEEPAAPVPTKAKSRSRKAAEEPAPEVAGEPKSENMNWYILKVQSNREESIREGLLRRVAIHGLSRYFDEVIVPTEKVTEFKAGKKRVIKRKLYPGYLVVHMEINEDTWFLVRETPGIGDFTGASGAPTPMLPHEVQRIVAKQEEKSEKAPDLKIPFTKGDRVKVIEGNFESFEGEVDTIDKANGKVTVMITIFNRTTPVEFEYWQVESL